VIERPEIEEAVEGSTVVWLRADAGTRAVRGAASDHRRALAPEEVERVTRREPRYEALADEMIDTTNLVAEEAVRLISEYLDMAGAGG
jgi:shikimate kinase